MVCVAPSQIAKGFMAEDVQGCDALVCALLSVAPDIPNADGLILRAAVATKHLAEQPSLRCERWGKGYCGSIWQAAYDAQQVSSVPDGENIALV